jgi:FHA domain-containing protein/type VI secretion system protein
VAFTVKIFNRSGTRPALYASRDFDKPPISIGRDAACTMVLEDPQKHISRFHVEIEEEDGVFWMSVVSKVNPVMVKGRRYGPGTRLTLASGDSFEIGEYEVQVTLPGVEGEATLLPPPPAGRTLPGMQSALLRVLASTPDAAAVDEKSLSESPLDLSEPGALDDNAIFEEPTYVGSVPQPNVTAPPVARPAPPPTPAAPLARPVTPPPAKPAPRPASPAAGGDLLRAFMEGAGLQAKEVSATEAERMLRDCGAILRAAVEGIMMLLIARSEMRKEFQAEDRTMVAARDNNPLKLMSDPHEAMAFLFDPMERTDGFLDPVQAVGDACEDLRAHELALMAGMRAAILGALNRLDPHALERAFDKSATGFALASRKTRLWDLYVAHQEKLSSDAQEDFNKVFGRDFMTAYQSQLRRLKGGK